MHGVSVEPRAHTRAPAAASPSLSDSGSGVWANVSASRVREATWARNFIKLNIDLFNNCIRIVSWLNPDQSTLS